MLRLVAGRYVDTLIDQRPDEIRSGHKFSLTFADRKFSHETMHGKLSTWKTKAVPLRNSARCNQLPSGW